LLAVLALHRDQILFLVHSLDARIFSCLDAVCLAASRVAHHVARFVLPGPLPVLANGLLPRNEHV
jgi:hypothetical protein